MATIEDERNRIDANIHIDRAIEMLKDIYKDEWLVAGYNGVVSLLGYAKESHAASLQTPSNEKYWRERCEAAEVILGNVPYWEYPNMSLKCKAYESIKSNQPQENNEQCDFAEYAATCCWWDDENKLWNTFDESEDPFRYTTEELYKRFINEKDQSGGFIGQ